MEIRKTSFYEEYIYTIIDDEIKKIDLNNDKEDFIVLSQGFRFTKHDLDYTLIAERIKNRKLTPEIIKEYEMKDFILEIENTSDNIIDLITHKVVTEKIDISSQKFLKLCKNVIKNINKQFEDSLKEIQETVDDIKFEKILTKYLQNLFMISNSKSASKIYNLILLFSNGNKNINKDDIISLIKDDFIVSYKHFDFSKNNFDEIFYSVVNEFLEFITPKMVYSELNKSFIEDLKNKLKK